MKMNMKDYKEYADRYFEGMLSDSEEQELKDFLASPEGAAKEYDELRAVMSFFAVGRGLADKKKRAYSIYSRIAVAAACLVTLFGIGLGIYNRKNVCVTFYKGAKITDKAVVMNDVESTLAELMSSDTGVYDQLSDFFNTEEE